jgi:chemotaxis response regulator CheB
VAAARKTRTAPPTTRAKNKRTKRRPVKTALPQAKPTLSTRLPEDPPGFLIVGIGASAGGSEVNLSLNLNLS